MLLIANFFVLSANIMLIKTYLTFQFLAEVLFRGQLNKKICYYCNCCVVVDDLVRVQTEELGHNLSAISDENEIVAQSVSW